MPTKRRVRLHPNVWVLALVSFLTDISTEMIVNLLPLFLANVLGVRTAAIGLIDGVAETTASLVKVYSGMVSDRLSKRKWLAVLGYSLSTFLKPWLYFASSWGWVLGIRFGDRIGKGIRNAPRDALLADSTDPNQRGFAFGLHRAGDTAGAFTGLGIAAVITWLTQTDGARLSRATFQMVVLASIIPALLAVLILSLGVREIKYRGKDNPNSTSLFAGWGQLDERFKAFLLVAVLFTLGNSSDAFIILRGQERGLNVMQVMGMLLTFNAVYSITSGPIGAFSDRIDRKRIILYGWLMYCCIYFGLGFSKTGWQVWGLYGAYGLYYAFTEGVAKALVADYVPKELRGTAYGLYYAAIGIAALPASLVGGVLWQGLGNWAGFGPAAPFFFGAFMSVTACALLVSRVNKP